MTKLSWMIGVAAIAGAAVIGIAAYAPAPKSVKIGYAISLSGPNAPAAHTSTLSNYRLWVKEVNAAGGIMLRSIGKRLPIEVIEYDDESKPEKAVEAVENLINKDKVDFILPPWGTGLSLAVGPLFHAAGYPHLAVTAISDRIPELAKLWPNTFWFQGTATEVAQALAATLAKLHSEGKIGNTVAMVSVADQLGIGLAKAERQILEKSGFNIIYDRSYTVGEQDMRLIVDEAKQLNPDSFIAFSYPPDTMALTQQARALNFSPKVFYTGIGTAYPLYKQRFGIDVEGVMGRGGWPLDTPEGMAFVKRYMAEFGQEPDRGGGPPTYASLQVLQQAIERAGKIDRAAVIEELRTAAFQTILGQIKMEGNRYMGTLLVGQWQNGEFQGIAPATLPGAHAIMFPKPAWSDAPMN
jgi:branched-chain amino acid transport system substrate-binding protein